MAREWVHSSENGGQSGGENDDDGLMVVMSNAVVNGSRCDVVCDGGSKYGVW